MILRSPAGIFVFVMLLCGLTAGGHLYSPDEEIMFRVTESLATRGALDVEPIRDPQGGTFATKAGENGREYAQYGVGNSLAAVPLYWLGALLCKIVPDQAADRLLHFQTTDYVPDGPGQGHALLKRLVVSFFGALVAAGTATLLWNFAWLLGGPFAENEQKRRHHAGMVALIYFATTLAWPQARTFFSEPLATFFVLLSLYYLAAARMIAGDGEPQNLNPHRALLAGSAFACALLTRPDSALTFPGIAFLLFLKLPTGGVAPIDTTGWFSRLVDWIEQRFTLQNFAILLTFALPILAVGLWQLAMNHIHFGDAFTSAYSDQREGIHFSTPLLAGLYGFFMSVGKSMILFSPGLVLGALGFAAFRKQYPTVAWSLALIVAVKIILQSKWQNWAGGWCWGPRHIFLVHAFAVLPALALFSGLTLSRRLFIDAVLLVGILVQLYGCSQNFIDYYILYYRTPFTSPNANVFYSPDDTAPTMMRLERVDPRTGQFVPASFAQLVAPINDSIYVPQNSQWYRYAEMWEDGYTDNLWLRLVQRARCKEQPVR